MSDRTKQQATKHAIIPSGPLPLYHLPELPKAGTIWVCGSEKATDAVRATGLPATTSAHGSTSASKANWTPLAGRDVVILPDNTGTGRKYARDVSRFLAKLEPPARVKIVSLPGLPEGTGIVEYTAARPDVPPENLAPSIVALADTIPFIDIANLIGGPVLVNMADVEAREIRWFWRGRIALGRITLIVGKPGEGKSFLTTDMASRVTTGTPWPDGTACPKGSVLLVCAEDDPGDTIRPRLDAHHADVHRVDLLSAVRSMDEAGKAHDVMFTLEDVRALEVALKRRPDCKLIVIDPIGSFLGGGTDAHRDNEVRAVLAPVARLAEQYGPAVVIVAHRRKSIGGSADDLALGSRAFTGIARAVWHVSRDGENPNRRLFLPGKNNLAPEGHGLAFSIVGEPVGALVWEREPVMMNADEALAAEQAGERDKPGPEPDAREEAGEWLTELLRNGPVASKKVETEAKAAGFALRTVRRAADQLKVKRERIPQSDNWQWRLLKLSNEVVQTLSDPNNLDNLDNLKSSGANPLNAPLETPTCPHSPSEDKPDNIEMWEEL